MNMPNEFHFDIFPSHSSKDKAVVRQPEKKRRDDRMNKIYRIVDAEPASAGLSSSCPSC